MSEMLLPQTVLRPELCRFQMIDAARADELPPSIRALETDEFDPRALRRMFEACAPGVKVVQMQRPPIEPALRAFAEKLLANRGRCVQDVDIRGERLSTAAEASLDEYLSHHEIPSLELAQRWKDMELAGIRAAEDLFSRERLELVFRRAGADLKSCIDFHDHAFVMPGKRKRYLNLTLGQFGVMFPDERDCVTDHARRIWFKTPTPRIWVSQAYDAHAMFDLTSKDETGAFHAAPVLGMEEDQPVERETQSVKICCEPAAFS